jgi:thiamine pyrophosphate-dependent acetolactate synthase large subunit-like protein
VAAGPESGGATTNIVERMTGGQAVVRSLAEHGVDVAYGIPGVRANSPAELEAAIAEASARNVPTVIDTPIVWTG